MLRINKKGKKKATYTECWSKKQKSTHTHTHTHKLFKINLTSSNNKNKTWIIKINEEQKSSERKRRKIFWGFCPCQALALVSIFASAVKGLRICRLQLISSISSQVVSWTFQSIHRSELGRNASSNSMFLVSGKPILRIPIIVMALFVLDTTSGKKSLSKWLQLSQMAVNRSCLVDGAFSRNAFNFFFISFQLDLVRMVRWAYHWF